MQTYTCSAKMVRVSHLHSPQTSSKLNKYLLLLLTTGCEVLKQHTLQYRLNTTPFKHLEKHMSEVEKIHIVASCGLDSPVEVKQTSKHKYKATYGLDVVKGLDFDEAFDYFKEFVRHSMECNGHVVK